MSMRLSMGRAYRMRAQRGNELTRTAREAPSIPRKRKRLEGGRPLSDELDPPPRNRGRQAFADRDRNARIDPRVEPGAPLEPAVKQVRDLPLGLGLGEEIDAPRA